MTVSRPEASRRFLEIREGHGDERAVSWGARKPTGSREVIEL
jgi:hypothetical protein